MNKKILSVILASAFAFGSFGIINVNAETLNNDSEIIDIADTPPIVWGNSSSGYTHYQNGDNHQIYVSMGKCSSSGYDIEIDSVTFNGNTATVHVIETYPDDDGYYMDVITYPNDSTSFTKEGITEIKVINQYGQELTEGVDDNVAFE